MNWALPLADRYFAPILAKDPRGFEIDHLDAALKHCKNFRTAVDGGAHIGTWSVALAAEFTRVIAFEPAGDTRECLRNNLAARRIYNVEVLGYALGETNGIVSICDDPRRPGNTGARHVDTRGGGYQVQVGPLDDFKLENVDFLKLDVEGYELAALHGARQTLLRCHPVVLIEVKDFRGRYGFNKEAASEFLLALGYRQVEQVRNDRIFVHP